MANIDNTVLCEIMVRLSECTKKALWKELFDSESSGFDSSMLNRFSSGNKKDTLSRNVAWWPDQEPNKGIFESRIKSKFVDYEEKKGLTDICDVIEKVCNEFRISTVYIKNIHKASAMSIIKDIINYCILEKGNVTQNW